MQRSMKTRLLYAVGFVLITVLAALCTAEWAQGVLETLILEEDVCGGVDAWSPACGVYGFLGVARLTFALGVYHLLLALVTVGVKSSSHPRAFWHNGIWFWKFLLLSGLVVAFWFIPNSFYVGWGYFALASAFLFAMAQFFLLVSVADSFNAHYVGRFEETEETSNMIRLGGLTLAFAGLAIALIVLLYANFSGKGCGINIFMTTFTLVMSVLICIMSVLPSVQEHKRNIGVLQAVVVAAYASYLTWIAIAGVPIESEDSCNQFNNEEAARLIALIPGSIFLSIALYYWIFADPSQSTDEYPPLLASSALVNTTSTSDAGEGGAADVDPDDDEVQRAVYSYTRFHVVLAAAALYLAMIISNWNTLEKYEQPETGPTLPNPPLYTLSSGAPALWLKWTAGAVSLLLYAFSLVAPMLFPDRSFD